jgi:hypothetical protein
MPGNTMPMPRERLTTAVGMRPILPKLPQPGGERIFTRSRLSAKFVPLRIFREIGQEEGSHRRVSIVLGQSADKKWQLAPISGSLRG